VVKLSRDCLGEGMSRVSVNFSKGIFFYRKCPGQKIS